MSTATATHSRAIATRPTVASALPAQSVQIARVTICGVVLMGLVLGDPFV